MRWLAWLTLVLSLGVIASAPPARAQDCEDREPCCDDPTTPSSVECAGIDVKEARDPNDKTGPTGSGLAHYIAGGQRLTYTIFFENKPTATAPAQEVRILDHLNLSGLDPATFSLESFGFGSTLRGAIPGLATYATSVDLRPGRDAIVNFSSAFDNTSGDLTIRFVTIDPATRQPTEDPLGGFLPPNVAPPEGEGFVTFSISPQSGIPTGTVISNQASIVFDVNPPIDTPVWSNTIDRSPPESQVAALPAVTGPKKFEVTWGGQDFDAGLRHFSLFVSKDGGPYETWLPATTAQADTFYGEHAHTYAFYSVAVDSVGNIEAPPSSADATTRIDTTTAAAAALVSAHAQRNRVDLTWFLDAETRSARMWRRALDTDWTLLAEVTPDANHFVTFADTSVTPGQRYGYRLGIADRGEERFVGEIWVQVPNDLHFAVRGARPNPAPGRIVADFSLADPGEATLELYSVTGRRIASRSVGALGPGDHLVPIGVDFRLPPGTYLVRLIQGERSATRKVTVE